MKLIVLNEVENKMKISMILHCLNICNINKMIDTVNSSNSETHGFSLCHSKGIIVDKFVKINKISDIEQSVS